MPQIINTNMASLNAQRNLNTSQNALATALQRLSSGLRINSAKDDAAGLAISDRFTTQIRGMNQAVRNANDGISLSQTGEGALAEVSANLQRIRELAVQAANATNSDSDRAALDLEVQQRLAEIDRIASQTNFNGRKILDGSFGNATFQVGADAGQTISLDLEGSTRTDDIGTISSVTSAVLGNAATGGDIDIAPSSLLFGTAPQVATAGNLTVTPATRLFGTVGAPQVDGTSQTMTHSTLLYGTAAAPQVDATLTTTAALTDFTFLGAANNAQFDIEVDGITYGITLAADFADAAAVAAEIQSQVRAASGNTNFTVAPINNGVDDRLVFANVGSTQAITISNVDTNGVAAGLADQVGGAGTPAVATTNASFDVDGVTVTLDQDYADTNALANDIISQLTGYTAVIDEGLDQITLSQVGSTAAVDITNADTVATATGFGNSTGIEGSLAISTTNASFTIDGHAITLDADYADFDAMAAALESKMDTAAGSDAYSIINNAGTFTIERTTTGAASTSIDITVADAVATASGFGVQAGVAGVDAQVTTNASFEVDGTLVTLATDYADYDAMAADIESQLTGYTVTNDAGTITITNDTLGSDAVTITNSDANAIAAGISDGSGTDGAAQGSVTLAAGEFTIAVGDGDAVDFEGTYEKPEDLAEAINRELSGIAAEITADGKLKLMSTEEITLSGTEAGIGGTMGFDTLAITPTGGSLDSVGVTDVYRANETIVRIDSALTSVSNLRSTFGAIQNRFESTISNLTATAENMTASRSRIMDADFAQETAALTRAQILQQAGTAMLAQANQIPQNVLSLLG